MLIVLCLFPYLNVDKNVYGFPHKSLWSGKVPYDINGEMTGRFCHGI